MLLNLYQHSLRFFHTFHQNINFFQSIVNCKTCTDSSGDVEEIHNGLGAMVSGSYSDSQFVKNHSCVRSNSRAF